LERIDECDPFLLLYVCSMLLAENNRIKVVGGSVGRWRGGLSILFGPSLPDFRTSKHRTVPLQHHRLNWLHLEGPVSVHQHCLRGWLWLSSALFFFFQADDPIKAACVYGINRPPGFLTHVTPTEIPLFVILSTRLIRNRSKDSGLQMTIT
jgi:hypothetical protein